MTRVLITGAAGFVGRQIMRALDVDGVSLVPVVRDVHKETMSNFRRVERVVVTPNLFAEEEVWWENICQGIDVVVHSAWYVEPTKYQQSPINIDCLMGSLQLAKGSVKAGIKRFVGIGTCAEYDQTQGILTIDTPLRPLTTYAAAKAALFTALSHWLPNQDVDFAWTRLFYLYGEGEDESRLIPYIRRQLANGEVAELTSGKQVRDFMNVADVGKKIAQVALSNQVGPINICSGVPTTVRQLAEKIGDEFGLRDLLRFGIRADNIFDPPCVIGIPNV